MKKIAFTLAEVLIVLCVIGIIATVLLANIKTDSYQQKANVSMARKIVSNFQNASLSIIEAEKDNCPMGAFILEVTRDNKIFGLIDETKADADIEDVLDLYGKYLKFEQQGLKFCDNTTYCSDNSILGAKFGKAYVGIKMTTDLPTCPNYKIPDPNAKSGDDIEETEGKGECWATLYIDTNGQEGPNVYGEDVYLFGMDATGVVL